MLEKWAGKPSWRTVTNGLLEIGKDIAHVILQGCVLSQILLNIFISDFNDRIKNVYSKFADATKLWRLQVWSRAWLEFQGILTN